MSEFQVLEVAPDKRVLWTSFPMDFDRSKELAKELNDADDTEPTSNFIVMGLDFK